MKKKATRLLTALLTMTLAMSLVTPVLGASGYDRPGQKLACLTFDDGPGPYSDAILDVLKKHGAKATFFMNGYKAWNYAPQIRRMVAEGHQIGNHTYSHPYLAKSSDAVIRKEVTSSAQVLAEITGLSGTGSTGFYLRPPYGSYNSHVAAVANVPTIWCTVDTGDWKYQDATRLVSYTGSTMQNGDIAVLHETVKSTAQGLDALLTKLESRGFEMVTVQELFWRRGINPKAGTIYYSAKNTGVDRCASELYWDESRLDTHWAWKSISYVKAKGLMTGNEFGEFTPQFPMTRGMFVTVLGRLSGVQATATASGFPDIPKGHYAAPYAAWAKKTAVMVGMDNGQFGVNEPMTRQQMAVALARYAALQGAQAKAFDLRTYKDSGDIADWARDGVAKCSALGLLQGSEGAFSPNAVTTRAMGAVVLQRLSTFNYSNA